MQALGICGNRRDIVGNTHLQRESSRGRTRTQHLELLLELTAEVHRGDVHRDRARLDPRQIQQFLGHPEDTLRLFMDDRGGATPLGFAQQASVDERLAETDEARQRGLQLVRHIGQEIALHLARSFDRLGHAIEGRAEHPYLVLTLDAHAS